MLKGQQRNTARGRSLQSHPWDSECRQKVEKAMSEAATVAEELALVVDGATLAFCLRESLSTVFLELATRCKVDKPRVLAACSHALGCHCLPSNSAPESKSCQACQRKEGSDVFSDWRWCQ